MRFVTALGKRDLQVVARARLEAGERRQPPCNGAVERWQKREMSLVQLYSAPAGMHVAQGRLVT